MKARVFFAILMTLGVLLSLSGCGAPATQPAPPTSLPTNPPPPPTPVPEFNLKVKVMDPLSAPIAGAVVEAGDKNVATDADGTAVLNNLPGEAVSVSVAASGYKAGKIDKILVPGDNALDVSLEEDPNGLLPLNACASDEKLLYVEDFQSGQARQWDAVEDKTPGWAVEGDPANQSNLVLAARNGAQWAWLGGRDTYSFDNAVWRLRFKYTGGGNSHINFRFVESPSLVRRYLIPVNVNEVRLTRFEPDKQLELGRAGKPAVGEWHLLEVGYYDGEVSLYLDGKKGLSWKDPNPWKGGTINLEPNPEGEAVFYYDNFSVCGLNAPFTPLPRPKTGYNLSATLKDAEGKPLASGSVTLVELGKIDEAVKISDENGQAAWSDLPGATATLQISAPGYKPLEKKVDLIKGNNAVEVSLERDPSGKLVSELCSPQETLLYSEDFQSGSVHSWDQLGQKIQLNIPGVSIMEDPDRPGNKLLSFQGQNDGEHNEAGRVDKMYGDAVLRYDFKMTGDIHQHLGWHLAEDGSGYIAFIYGIKGGGGRLEKCSVPQGGGPCQMVQVAQWNLVVGNGKWHRAEISFYQGEVQIWMDGKKLVKWTDPQASPQGSWSLAHDFWRANASAVYDNFAVCGLKASFETMPLPKTKP
jgi:hypothetical protein